MTRTEVILTICLIVISTASIVREVVRDRQPETLYCRDKELDGDLSVFVCVPKDSLKPLETL